MPRISLKSSISQDYFHIEEYFFVDDFMIIQVAPKPNIPLQETVKMAQKGLNIFAWEIKSTGGQVSAENIK